MIDLLSRTESPFGSLTVRDAMHRGIVTCDPGASMTEVVAGHAECGIHSVAVAEPASEDGAMRPWGHWLKRRKRSGPGRRCRGSSGSCLSVVPEWCYGQSTQRANFISFSINELNMCRYCPGVRGHLSGHFH